MEDQINRLRALEASSSPKGGNNGALSSTGGFDSLDVRGVSAKQLAAGGAQQASQRAASSSGGAGAGGGALSNTADEGEKKNDLTKG